jgi:hypothetical protein
MNGAMRFAYCTLRAGSALFAQGHPCYESSMPAIYLSGPITGTTARADNWRAEVRRKLPSSYKFFDPTKQDPDRSVGYLRSLSSAEDLVRLRHGKFIADRNRHLIRRSDVLLCCLLGAGRRVSIGSVGEIHWANAFNVPIIVVRERTGNVHDHAILNALTSELCFSIDEACQILLGMFGVSKKNLRYK